MWIKALIAGVDRIIHGGKHYPVIDGVANVPQEVRDDLVGHTHFEDATHEIAPETQEAVIKATEVAQAPAEDGAADDGQAPKGKAKAKLDK